MQEADPDPKFKNIYRIQSARMVGYDYSQTGLYFVTICTRGREKYFGEVKEGAMELSGIGEIVKEELLKTGEIRPNVNIDEWVIMPNHVHVIIALDNQAVETHCNASLQREMNYKNTFGPQRNNLSSIVRGFKGAVARRVVKELNISNFAWQSRFHDHIIHDDRSLEKIRQYILENPTKWFEDEMFV